MALLDEKNTSELDLDRLFGLCRLSLPETEKEREDIKLSLTAAADYIYPLLNSEEECVLPLSSVHSATLGELREDISAQTGSLGEGALALSEFSHEGYFSVPRVIGEDKK